MIIAEIIFQNREKGLDSGFSFDILSNESIKLIDYLKSIRHWYPRGELCGGVELTLEQCEFINRNIFNRELLFNDNKEFEMILGFYKHKALADNYYVLELSKYGVYFASYILPETVVDLLKYGQVTNNFEINRMDFKILKMRILELDCRPFSYEESTAMRFHIKRVKTDIFTINEDYTRGIES